MRRDAFGFILLMGCCHQKRVMAARGSAHVDRLNHVRRTGIFKMLSSAGSIQYCTMDPNMILRYYDGLVEGLTIYRIEKRNTNQREQ